MNVKEVKAVQECGHSESPHKNTSEPEGNEGHLSSPVSEFGQRRRNHYRTNACNPVTDENSSFHVSEDKLNEVEVNIAGRQDAHENEGDVDTNIGQRPILHCSNAHSQVQSYATTSLSQLGNSYSTSSHAVLLKSQDLSNEQNLKTPNECEFEKNYDNSVDSASSSFCIESSELSQKFSLRDILTSYMSHRSTKDFSNQSGLLEDLINSYLAHSHQSLQTKPSFSNQEDNMDSIKSMLINLIKNAHALKEGSLPSLYSFILWNFNNGKSLDLMTRQLSSLGFPDDGINAILKAECCDPQCSNTLCIKVQHCVRKLQDMDETLKDLSEEEKCVLWCMQVHCRSCDHLHCPLYWCQKEAFLGLNDQTEILAKMKQLVEHGYHNNFLNGLMDGIFEKFVQDIPLSSTPRESTDWYGLCRLLGANSSILVQPAMEETGEFWIIKKCRMYKSFSQRELYEKLRQISTGIAVHLWTSYCLNTRYMAVCVGYEAFSLYERLQESPIKNLHIVVRIMLQLISTTKHLHEKGILYLNWSSKNVVFSFAEQIKLTNFTCSAVKSRMDEDIVDIMLSLPRHLIAPEMLTAIPKADELTDIWGLGCLLKEISIGQPIWYEHLHEPDSVLHKKIMENSPSIPHDPLELFFTFKACWQRERSNRPSLDKLQEILMEAKDK